MRTSQVKWRADVEQFVKGSHLWDHSRRPKADEVAYAEMSLGEAFIFLGSTVHGGGHNATSKSRTVHGFFYCRSFLRPEVSAGLPQHRESNFDGSAISSYDVILTYTRKINSCGGRKKRLTNGPMQQRSKRAMSWKTPFSDIVMKQIPWISSEQDLPFLAFRRMSNASSWTSKLIEV